MKNILVVESSRDNQIPAYAFIKDINLIAESNLKNAIEFLINNPTEVRQEEFGNGISVCYGILYADRGYFLSSQFPFSNDMLPLTIEHIVNSVF